MRAFDYVAPSSVDEAVRLLADGGEGARPLAGGTDLIVQMRNGQRGATLLVDVKRIPEMNQITHDLGLGVTIGAAVPCCRICEDEVLGATYPGLIDAVSLIGGAAIQSRATLGGNLCNAAPSADSVPALAVLGAEAIIEGPAGRRCEPVESLAKAPGETVLGTGDLLVAIRLPPPRARSGACYLRFTPRGEMDLAVAGAAAYVELDTDFWTIVCARIALGAVAPTVLVPQDAGDALAGKTPSEEAFALAGAMAQQAVRPITDVRGSSAQRRHLAGVLTRRALRTAVRRARGEAICV